MIKESFIDRGFIPTDKRISERYKKESGLVEKRKQWLRYRNLLHHVAVRKGLENVPEDEDSDKIMEAVHNLARNNRAEEALLSDLKEMKNAERNLDKKFEEMVGDAKKEAENYRDTAEKMEEIIEDKVGEV